AGVSGERAREHQCLERLRFREREAANGGEYQQEAIDAARPEAIEQQAERDLEQAEGKEVHAGQEAELACVQAEFARERRPEQGVYRAEHVGEVVPRQERQDYLEDDQLFGASRPPRMNRFHVGLMMISFTQTRAG